jgi:small subunit ribosomal protein S16
MLKIRLQRVGRKHEPTFRVVLTESQNSTKSGRMLEILGSHDPRHKDMTALNAERITYWISKGAKPTDTMHNMLISKKIIQGKKVNALPRKTPIKKEGDAAEASQTAAPVAEAIVEPVVEAETPAAEPASEAAPAEETPTA